MFVRLIVAGGLNAGTVAEIKQGYYLVGRHEECQIRPESDSVSERHCLLQHEGKFFRVFVLDDNSPTELNHKPLAAKQWAILNHGDLLQVGRVSFMVAITAQDPSAPVQTTSPTPRRKAKRASSDQDDFAKRDTAEIEAEELQKESSAGDATTRQRPPGRWKTPKQERPREAADKAANQAKQAADSRAEPPPPSSAPPPSVPPPPRRWRPHIDWQLLLAMIFIIAAVGIAGYGAYYFLNQPDTNDVRLMPEID